MASIVRFCRGSCLILFRGLEALRRSGISFFTENCTLRHRRDALPLRPGPSHRADGQHREEAGIEQFGSEVQYFGLVVTSVRERPASAHRETTARAWFNQSAPLELSKATTKQNCTPAMNWRRRGAHGLPRALVSSTVTMSVSLFFDPPCSKL